MKRIFVRALSRSGGTLMVTVLDAHPEIAMGYELYEHLLTPFADLEAPKSSGTFARFARAFRRPSRHETIAGRALRGGVDAKAFDALVWEHIETGAGFKTFDGKAG